MKWFMPLMLAGALFFAFEIGVLVASGIVEIVRVAWWLPVVVLIAAALILLSPLWDNRHELHRPHLHRHRF